MATATASDSSSSSFCPESPRSRSTIDATWSFVADPVPTTDSFTSRGAYSKTGTAAWAAASNVTPRAWPSLSADLTFFAWKTFSTAISSSC